MSDVPTNPSYDLPDVERITVGTVGPVGQRVFYLQARQGRQIVTLKLEKAHVVALAQWIAGVLAELPQPDPIAIDMDLETPIEPDWAVGSLGGHYDIDRDRIVLVAGELSLADDEPLEEDDDAPVRGAVALFGATRAQMAALAIHGAALVEAGRPPCPLCGYPLDPTGHTCPRRNGSHPPKL